MSQFMIDRNSKPESEETQRKKSAHHLEDLTVKQPSLSKLKGKWYPPHLALVQQPRAVAVTIADQEKKLPIKATKKTRNIEERSFPELGHNRHPLF